MNPGNRVILGYSGLLLAALCLFFWNPLVERATEYNSEISIAGVGIYASLRGVVSAMSFVRDADIQVAVPFASIAGSPGQALQPVIATVERMANLLFALVLASGVLSVALPSIGSLGAATLAAGALGRIALHLVGNSWPSFARNISGSFIQIGVVAVFVLPAAYALAFAVGDSMTADAWDRASGIFEQQAAELEGTVVTDGPVAIVTEDSTESIDTAAPGQDGGLLDWANRLVGDAVQGSGEAIQNAVSSTANFATAVTRQVSNNAMVINDGIAMAGSLFEASVQIGVAYLVKIAVLPLVIGGAFMWILRGLLRNGDNHRTSTRISHQQAQALATESKYSIPPTGHRQS